ncbi:hypothetical protein [Nocardia grenadensis]|uniref:hypothetical protein n=1 Tax=Nocardia grenadensis TaxID=931537 RepID=UPI0035A220F3
MFLTDPLDVPFELVGYLAEQLGIEDPCRRGARPAVWRPGPAAGRVDLLAAGRGERVVLSLGVLFGGGYTPVADSHARRRIANPRQVDIDAYTATVTNPTSGDPLDHCRCLKSTALMFEVVCNGVRGDTKVSVAGDGFSLTPRSELRNRLRC